MAKAESGKQEMMASYSHPPLASWYQQSFETDFILHGFLASVKMSGRDQGFWREMLSNCLFSVLFPLLKGSPYRKGSDFNRDTSCFECQLFLQSSTC